jgi:hypothetical protein
MKPGVADLLHNDKLIYQAAYIKTFSQFENEDIKTVRALKSLTAGKSAYGRAPSCQLLVLVKPCLCEKVILLSFNKSCPTKTIRKVGPREHNVFVGQLKLSKSFFEQTLL